MPGGDGAADLGTILDDAATPPPRMGRLEEPLNRHPVDVVFHGHAHHGTLEGRTAAGTPVYNVAMPLLLAKCPGRPPFRVVELATAAPSETAAALEQGSNASRR